MIWSWAKRGKERLKSKVGAPLEEPSIVPPFPTSWTRSAIVPSASATPGVCRTTVSRLAGSEGGRLYCEVIGAWPESTASVLAFPW